MPLLAASYKDTYGDSVQGYEARRQEKPHGECIDSVPYGTEQSASRAAELLAPVRRQHGYDLHVLAVFEPDTVIKTN